MAGKDMNIKVQKIFRTQIDMSIKSPPNIISHLLSGYKKMLIHQLTYKLKGIRTSVDFSREVLKSRDLGITYSALKGSN